MSNYTEAARIMMKTNGSAPTADSLVTNVNHNINVPPTGHAYNEATVNVSTPLDSARSIISNGILNRSFFTQYNGGTIGTDWAYGVFRESRTGPYGQPGIMMSRIGRWYLDGATPDKNVGPFTNMHIDASSTVDNVKGSFDNFYINDDFFLELYYTGQDYSYDSSQAVAIYYWGDPLNQWYTTNSIGEKINKRDLTGLMRHNATVAGEGPNNRYYIALTSKVFNSRKGATTDPAVGGYVLSHTVYSNWFQKSYYYGSTLEDDYVYTWDNNLREGYVNIGSGYYSFFNYSDTIFWTNPNYYYPTVLKRLMQHIYKLQEEEEI